MVGAGEVVTFFANQYPVARFEHECESCGRVVGRGERYERVSLPGGDEVAWKACWHCSVLCAWLSLGGGVRVPELVQEWVASTIFEVRVRSDWERGWVDDAGVLVPYLVLVGEGRSPVLAYKVSSSAAG